MTIVAVIGLGYVGLPLAVEFGKKFDTIGFDLAAEKIAHVRRHHDPTGEVSPEQFAAASRMRVTDEAALVGEADFLIVAVPTPVDEAHQPDFAPLRSASMICGRHMKRGATVIYESTVYPGATEEVCIPVLERESGMRWKHDFHVGYSPERINPGDREHTLTRIVKVVSGDDAETLGKVARLYETIVTAGVHRASSIKVAEAAKVIENTQRDLNIALVNELALIFDRIGIDTLEVLNAAGTKWNFLPFRPGLVGGHCIGVDPYYLTHKAEMLGYHPQVILAGRRINDGMGAYVAQRMVKEMIAAGFGVKGEPIIVFGLTFKEDVPDLRNSKVIDVIRELRSYGAVVHVHDPVADPEDAMHEYGVSLTAWEALPRAAAAVVAVPHAGLRGHGPEGIAARLLPGAILADVKSVFEPAAVAAAGLRLWRL
ncbi:MAG: nucleotide sugar dehydrogenase [Lautropia sp.]|nr:MAG: nucleotide sugar dehydrogenase [Pseudomonadota bacterium]MBC6960382.1 nucleotide sugar dehydrogenase [Lautropia sp.]MCL4702143.1 nucleotide sugar dehydrogenase [Burkholderiaceae bacterium]MDL1908128.1 nucleotide sugar dehydrogenase [Betaproteobacteria bacterium PRO1]RIK87253.1 MAG: nucleotide sugar dehydrogenase [Burkholderiales bacterium]